MIVTLLGLVAEASGLFWSCWSWRSVDGGQLTQLPGAHALNEAHHVRLLLLVELLDVLVGAHDCIFFSSSSKALHASSKKYLQIEYY